MTTFQEKEQASSSSDLLTSQEQAICKQIAKREAPHSQRASALLALNEGSMQAQAAGGVGLSTGQVKYWLARFRKQRLGIFPDALLDDLDVEAEAVPEKVDPPMKKTKEKKAMKKTEKPEEKAGKAEKEENKDKKAKKIEEKVEEAKKGKKDKKEKQSEKKGKKAKKDQKDKKTKKSEKKSKKDKKDKKGKKGKKKKENKTDKKKK